MIYGKRSFDRSALGKVGPAPQEDVCPEETLESYFSFGPITLSISIKHQTYIHQCCCYAVDKALSSQPITVLLFCQDGG